MSRRSKKPQSREARKAKSERLLSMVLESIPGTTLRNRSVTTSSMYLKTPDGRSLRIGDHDGKEKYKYKWNLGNGNAGWVKDGNVWRFYTNDVNVLAAAVAKSVEYVRANFGLPSDEPEIPMYGFLQVPSTILVDGVVVIGRDLPVQE